MFDVVSRAEPAVVDIRVGTHEEQRAYVGDGHTDRLRAAQGSIRRGNNHVVDIVAIEVTWNIKVRSRDKSQNAGRRVDREPRRIRSACHAVGEGLNRQIGVGRGDGGHGRGVLGNADAGRRRSTVAGDNRRVIVERRNRKAHQHTGVRTDTVVDGERKAVGVGFRSVMIIRHDTRIDIRLSKRVADAQSNPIQPQDPVHRDRIQRINQLGRCVVHVRGQQRGRGNNVPNGVLSKRLPSSRHEDLFVVDAVKRHIRDHWARRQDAIADGHAVCRSRFVGVMHELDKSAVDFSLSETCYDEARVGHKFESSARDAADGEGQLSGRVIRICRQQVGIQQNHSATFADRQRIRRNHRRVVGSLNGDGDLSGR